MVKVAVCGAAGGIGAPLSLLLKTNDLVSELALYDIVGTPGVAADLSHVNTPARVTAHMGPEQLKNALMGAAVVVIPAGVPRKPGMSRDDLFGINAGIVHSLATACALHCPRALIAVISNPVNSMVPIVAEVFKKHGVYDQKRIFGVTTLDVVRASTFVAELKRCLPAAAQVAVIGGHSGQTIIPVLSDLPYTFSDSEFEALVHRIQNGGDEVVKAKNGSGSATLSMAYAGSRFVDSLLQAIVLHKTGILECSYVKSDVVEGVDYFATQVELGSDGIERVLPLPKLDQREKKLLEAAIPELKQSIEKGVSFVDRHHSSSL